MAELVTTDLRPVHVLRPMAFEDLRPERTSRSVTGECRRSEPLTR